MHTIQPIHLFRTLLFLIAALLPIPANSGTEQSRILYSMDNEVPELFPLYEPASVDVYYCVGDDQSESRELLATELGSSVATLARLRNPSLKNFNPVDVPIIFIKSVRLHPIKIQDLQIRSNFDQANSIQIFASGSRSGLLSMAIQDISPIPLTEVIDSELISNLVKIVICENVDPMRSNARVFFQVASDSQKSISADSISAIRKLHLGINVASGIEIVGKRAPVKTQVRYFYENDKQVAEQIAGEVSKTLKTNPEVIFLSSLASKTSIGTVEVWLGSNYRPPSRTTFYVCNGEFRGRCPNDAVFLPCGTSIVTWAKAKSACQSFDLKKLSSISGNRCGYDISLVTCYGPNE